MQIDRGRERRGGKMRDRGEGEKKRRCGRVYVQRYHRLSGSPDASITDRDGENVAMKAGPERFLETAAVPCACHRLFTPAPRRSLHNLARSRRFNIPPLRRLIADRALSPRWCSSPRASDRDYQSVTQCRMDDSPRHSYLPLPRRRAQQRGTFFPPTLVNVE